MSYKTGLTIGYILLFGILCLMPSEIRASEEEIQIELEKLVLDLEQQLAHEPIKFPFKVVILGFSYENGAMKCTSDFSTYLSEKLEHILPEKSRLKVMGRSQVKQTLEKHNWQTETMTPVLPENIGRLLDADAVMLGEFTVGATRIEIRVQLKQVQTRKLLAHANVLLAKTAIPQSIALFSENNESVSFADFDDIEIDSLEKIEMDVFVNHSLDHQYRGGEEIKIYVKPKKDCHVRVLHRDTKGKDTILFPRKGQKDFVKANQTLTIPPKNSYKLVAVKPYGTERLKVMASTRPFGNIRRINVKKLREVGTQTLGNQEKPAYAEQSVTIRIVPEE